MIEPVALAVLFWSGGADDPLDLDVPSALTALWL